MHMSHQKLGELNGVWAFLFKLSNLAVPCVVAWCAWATMEIYGLREEQARTKSWMDQGPRFTAVDADRLRLLILDQVREDAKINQDAIMDELKGLRIDMTEFKVLLATHMAKENGEKKP